MTILAVDDEEIMLERISECIREAAPEATLHSFRTPREAYDCVRNTGVDVAFLDIKMRGMDGLTLGKEIKRISPQTNIIFCTGFDDYIYQAVKEIRCSGYLLKPATVEDVKAELENLRFEVKSLLDQQSDLYIECFGNFELFYMERPVMFESAKSKELVAYLIDRRGTICTNKELMSALWDDDKDHSAYLKKCRKDVIDTLHMIGCDDIILKSWGGLAVDRDKVNCDYYAWLQGKAEGIKAFNGNYMEQYSWAEVTKAGLREMVKE